MCKTWDIPFLSLDGLNPEEISVKIEEMDPKPRVLLSTISRVADKSVQTAIRRLPVVRICLDEAQVDLDFGLDLQHLDLFRLRTVTGALDGDRFSLTGVYHNTRYLLFVSSQELWDWFASTYPRAAYCLASASLTDSAVTDITGAT